MELSVCRKKWQELIEADRVAESIRHEFVQSCYEEVVSFVREALTSREGTAFVFRLIFMLPMEHRKELFADFLSLACEASYVPTIVRAREVLSTLPRPWAVNQLEASADSVLGEADDWVWRRFLETASLLDRDLTLRLAQRAMQHAVPDIRDAGAEFLANPNPSF